MKTVISGDLSTTSKTTRVPAMARKTMLVLTAVLALGSTANLNAGDMLTEEGTKAFVIGTAGAIIGSGLSYATNNNPIGGALIGGVTGGAIGKGIHNKIFRKTYGAFQGLISPSEESKRIAAERRLAKGGK